MRLGQSFNMVFNFCSWGKVTYSMVVLFVSLLAGLINFDDRTKGFFNDSPLSGSNLKRDRLLPVQEV
jgi:hypothetical protein